MNSNHREKKYFLSRVSSTEEYAEISFCYVEIENLEQFRADLKKMRKAFSETRLKTPVSLIDFPESDSVRTFYLNADGDDFLECLLEKHEQFQNHCFVELSEPVASDFLDENESDVSISEYKIRFIEKDLAYFIGRFKHYYGEAQTDAIRRDLIFGD